MIELLNIRGPDHRRLVQQKLIHPSVYLDTWAIRAFADDPALATRFRTALLAANGTLVISALSLVDFSSLSDPRNTAAAAAFIDSVMPHVFFSRFEPFEIQNREYAVMAGTTRSSPFGDEGMLALFAELAGLHGGRLSIAHFFHQVHLHREQVLGFRGSLAKAVKEGIRSLRDYADERPGVRADMRNPLKHADLPRSTRALMRMIFAEIEAPETLSEDENSAIDMFHAIAPAAYCTYVLVDGEWEARLGAAKKRAEKAGLSATVAKSYSKRRNGLELFLQDLESRSVQAPAA